MELWESVARELCSMPALLWVAVQDRRYFSVSRRALGFVSVVLLLAGCFSKLTWQERVGGAAFGAILLLFCYFSKEALGLADGVLIFVCGVAFGLYETVGMCFLAALYAGMVSAFLLLTKKAGRKSRIPFLPFLLLGYLTMRVLVTAIEGG